MIVLFRDSSINYWLNNSVVDCGNAETPNNYLDIEFPEDISSDDLYDLIELEHKTNFINNKKLNKKHKHNNDITNNESKYQKVYIGRNEKIINGNPGKKDSNNKSIGHKYKYKNSSIRINDIQTSIEHKYLHQHSRSNHNKGKLREMSKSSSLYYNE
jgi:hypothetical protein